MTPLRMYSRSTVIYLFSYHACADTIYLALEGNQQIFTSPNQLHLPNTLPPSFDLPQSSTAFFTALWNPEKYLYLAFISNNPTPPSSSLTEWLATEPKKILLCFSSGRWSLHPATITAWKSLEKNFITSTLPDAVFSLSLPIAHRFRVPTVFISHPAVHSNAAVLRLFLDASQIQRPRPPIYSFFPACITPRLSSSKHRCMCLHSNYTPPPRQPPPMPPSLSLSRTYPSS
jgi:hypothetical protein